MFYINKSVRKLNVFLYAYEHMYSVIAGAYVPISYESYNIAMQQKLNSTLKSSSLQIGGGTALSSAYYGPGTGSIWLSEIDCVGTESRLFDCPCPGIGTSDCAHVEDASVQCNAGAVLHANFISAIQLITIILPLDSIAVQTKSINKRDSLK